MSSIVLSFSSCVSLWLVTVMLADTKKSANNFKLRHSSLVYLCAVCSCKYDVMLFQQNAGPCWCPACWIVFCTTQVQVCVPIESDYSCHRVCFVIACQACLVWFPETLQVEIYKLCLWWSTPWNVTSCVAGWHHHQNAYNDWGIILVQTFLKIKRSDITHWVTGPSDSVFWKFVLMLLQCGVWNGLSEIVHAMMVRMHNLSSTTQ